MQSELKVICLESEAFYQLVREVVDRIKSENKIENDFWIDDIDAMRLLGIKSKTTLQKYRDENKIVFSKMGKIILYDRKSIQTFIAQNTNHL